MLYISEAVMPVYTMHFRVTETVTEIENIILDRLSLFISTCILKKYIWMLALLRF